MTEQRRSYLASPLARAATTVEAGRLTEIAGLVVPYSVETPIGYFREIIHPGAFAASIKRAKGGIPLLLLHDSQRIEAVLGRAMPDDFSERRNGLHVRFVLNGSDASQDAAQLARDGGLSYFSIGFHNIRTTERSRGDDLIVEVHEARLLEVSLVSTPAYVDALVGSVRSAAPVTPRDVAAAAHLIAAGNDDLAGDIYLACQDLDLPVAQRDAVSEALIRWAPHGPRYLRHVVTLELDSPGTVLPAGALARIGIALHGIRGTQQQEAASAAAIRRHHLGADADQPRTLPVSRRRRRTP